MPNNRLKILFAAAEAAPIAKVGGLADVAGALPKALVKLGVDVRVIIPFYGAIDRSQYRIKPVKQSVKVGADTINLWQTDLPDSAVTIYLIEHDLFKGKEIYGSTLADSSADIKKFIFFSRAIPECAKAVNFSPNIIHLNDWHTAIVSELIKTDSFFERAKTLLTIHNLANQGIIGSKNLLADGIINADLITTVSPTYAKEILTKQYGAGLEKILLKRKKQLYGILNSLDTDYYNPAADRLIKYNYSAEEIKNKTLNKLALQKQLGLPADEKIALVSLVSRLVWQKGLELIDIPLLGGTGVGIPLQGGARESIFPSREGQGWVALGKHTPNPSQEGNNFPCQFVFLGAGEKKYEEQLKRLAKKYPNQVSAQIKFDEALAHQVYAASDIFLVPSRFEPCGLTQMIAMRYGAVPLVRETGGLADTVTPLTKGGWGVSSPLTRGGRGVARVKPTGFTFKEFTASAFSKTLTKALDVYYNHPPLWQKLQINGITQDFSWDKSAREYVKLYKSWHD